MTARRGILIILSSPSGAGKSTLAGRLMKWDDSLSFSVSATTRAPRDGEQDGREYFFRSHDEFRQMGIEGVRKLGKPGHVLYDIKHIFGAGEADARL